MTVLLQLVQSVNACVACLPTLLANRKTFQLGARTSAHERTRLHLANRLGREIAFARQSQASSSVHSF